MKGCTRWGSEGVLQGVEVAQYVRGGGAGMGAALFMAILCFDARIHEGGDGTL